uniref:Uncharacterized protein n=1 Tax=Triticum urartu TaxID=4572 RepID=A0A8R7PDI8_TRIUA
MVFGPCSSFRCPEHTRAGALLDPSGYGAGGGDRSSSPAICRSPSLPHPPLKFSGINPASSISSPYPWSSRLGFQRDSAPREDERHGGYTHAAAVD